MQTRHELKGNISLPEVIEIMKRVERMFSKNSTQCHVMDLILDKVEGLLTNRLSIGDRQETLIKIINLLENLLLRLDPKSLEYDEVKFIIEQMTKG